MTDTLDSGSAILIVGQGLSGTILAHRCHQSGIPFKILDNGHRTASSLAAAGLFNPLIIKRQRKAWGADEFLPSTREFYTQLEKELDHHFYYESGIIRRVSTVKELNDWDVKMGLDAFESYITECKEFENESVKKGEGHIRVLQSGRLDVELFLKLSKERFKALGAFIEGEFDDQKVALHAQDVRYDGESYARLILCRGYKEMKDSRFFPNLPFNPAKGQTILVRIPGLNLIENLHAGVFILPLGEDLYRVGSTYSWSDFSENPERDKTSELLDKLGEVCSLEVEIQEENAGVRPATKDRRPMIGKSKEDERILLFNGMGSRAVMIAPRLSVDLIHLMQKGQGLMPEIDLNRFP